jgi:hypothetical protein
VDVLTSRRYIGTMQICVARMLRESGIFFAVRNAISYTVIVLTFPYELAVIRARHRVFARPIRSRCG